jgi:hypothetical protein
MIRAFAQPRILLTIALIVPVLLCCCGGRLAARFFAQFGTPETAAQVAPAGWSGESEHGCCGTRQAPEAPAPADDSRSCECEKVREARQLPESGPSLTDTSVCAPVVRAVEAPAWAVVSPARVRQAVAAPAPKPPSSLLRQHCALVI